MVQLSGSHFGIGRCTWSAIFEWTEPRRLLALASNRKRLIPPCRFVLFSLFLLVFFSPGCSFSSTSLPSYPVYIALFFQLLVSPLCCTSLPFYPTPPTGKSIWSGVGIRRWWLLPRAALRSFPSVVDGVPFYVYPPPPPPPPLFRCS